MVEFVRLGARQGKKNIGCCAIDVIQNFYKSRTDPSVEELFDGDTLTSTNRFAAGTAEDVFKNLLRIGTFSTREMPDHAFVCSLTEGQLRGQSGKDWMALLKESGFEWVGCVNNSVYGGSFDTKNLPGPQPGGHPHTVHIFMLIRNITKNGAPQVPPAGWNDLPAPVSQLEQWNAGTTTLYTRETIPDEYKPLLPKQPEPKAKPMAVQTITG